MKKDLNYEAIYQQHYKRIPYFYFIGTLLVFGLGVLVTGIVLWAVTWEASLGVSIILGGTLVSVLLAYSNCYFASVAISQKVVVADTLLSMKNGTASTPAIDEDLPEL